MNDDLVIKTFTHRNHTHLCVCTVSERDPMFFEREEENTPLGSTGIRRNNGAVLPFIDVFFYPFEDCRLSVQVINWDVKEPLTTHTHKTNSLKIKPRKNVSVQVSTIKCRRNLRRTQFYSGLTVGLCLISVHER